MARAGRPQWRRLESYRGLLPAESPEYLKELFCLECACHAGDSRESFQRTGLLGSHSHNALAISVHPNFQDSLDTSCNIAAEPGGEPTPNLLF